MTPPADFAVDLDALTALQSELTRLSTAVDGLRCLHGSSDHQAMGGEDVADAIDRFVNRWRSGRLDVVQQLSSCAEIVKLAIDGYGDTDDQLRCAVAPTTEARP